MKYILKKDLPFANIGDKVFVRDSISCKNYIIISVSDAVDAPCCYAHKGLSSDWVEEVRPREWYLIPNSLPVFEPYAVRSVGSNMDGFKNIIKVREVIE